MFDFLYHHCYRLGSAFGFGAFEGFVLYLGTIALAITTVMDSKKAKK